MRGRLLGGIEEFFAHKSHASERAFTAEHAESAE
jgi:hypothetical protein